MPKEYNAATVQELTGLDPARVAQWVQLGVDVPGRKIHARARAYTRNDIVTLAMCAELRRSYSVGSTILRKVIAYCLKERGLRPSNLAKFPCIAIVGKQLHKLPRGAEPNPQAGNFTAIVIDLEAYNETINAKLDAIEAEQREPVTT